MIDYEGMFDDVCAMEHKARQLSKDVLLSPLEPETEALRLRYFALECEDFRRELFLSRAWSRPLWAEQI